MSISPTAGAMQDVTLPSPPVPDSTTDDARIDLREQLYNNGDCGPIADVQFSKERITKLRGILLDVDPKLFRKSSAIPQIPDNPEEFYRLVLLLWLSRHPVLTKAEVRCSGTGIHVILWFADPPEFNSDEERRRWEGIVLIVQRVLPADSDQPGITAVTRPIGSINSKNGAKVVQLAAPTTISSEEIISLADQMRGSPFRTLTQIVFDTDRITPCPKCGQPGTHLASHNWNGTCYGSCGKVTLTDLYDLLLVPRGTEAETGGNHDGK